MTLRWLYAAMIAIGLGVACAPALQADDNGPEGVRVQSFDHPRYGGTDNCLIFTHDTAQGASIAVVC